MTVSRRSKPHLRVPDQSLPLPAACANAHDLNFIVRRRSIECNVTALRKWPEPWRNLIATVEPRRGRRLRPIGEIHSPSSWRLRRPFNPPRPRGFELSEQAPPLRPRPVVRRSD